MCTSVAIGFYIRGEDEFEKFKLKLTALSKLDNSIFSVYENKPLQIKNKQDEVKIDGSKENEEMEDDFVVI